MFDKCLEFLSTDQNMRIVFNTLEGNYALCLLANLIQLAHSEREYAQNDSYYPTFVVRWISVCTPLPPSEIRQQMLHSITKLSYTDFSVTKTR